MKLPELSFAALALMVITALFSATTVLVHPSTEVAQTVRATSQKGNCKLGDLEFRGASSIGEQECKRGAEYEIIAPKKKGDFVYDIKTKKCPPSPPPTPRGVNPEVWKKQWEAKQPEGVVSLKTPTNGTLIVTCDKKLGSSGSFMKEVGDISRASLGEARTTSPESPRTPSAPARESSYAFQDSFDEQPPSSSNSDGTEKPKTSLEDLAKEIAQKRNDLNNSDPAIQRAAQDYLALQSRLGEGRYIGVESSERDGTLGGAIQKDVREASARNTALAISDTFANADGVYVTNVEQKGLATRVLDRATGSETFYSNVTGRPFLEVDGNALSLISADGSVYPVAPDGEWQNKLGTLDKTEYDVFADNYLSPREMPVQSFKYDPPVAAWTDDTGAEIPPATSEYPNGRVTITDSDGNKKVIPADEYWAVIEAGKRVYDTDQLAREINQWTHGKILLSPPEAFPSSKGGFFAEGGNVPASSLTPQSIGQYASAMEKMYDVYKQMPPELWANEGIQPTDVYTFAQDPAAPKVRAAGIAYLGGGSQWSNPDAHDVYMTTGHELGHTLGNVFPSDQQWGSSVYGESWQRAYGGKDSVEAYAAGKLGYDRAPGYATTYGFAGGVREDQAEIFGAMLTNYPAVQHAAASDPALNQKMQMVQDSFSAATGGVMNQNYWNNMKVLDSDFFLAQSNPNFLTTLYRVLGAKRAGL